MNNDIPEIRDILKHKKKEVKECSRDKNIKQCKYTAIVALLLSVMYFAYVSHHKKKKNSFSMDDFLQQLPNKIQSTHKIPIGSTTETYQDTRECLKYIDTSLHKIFSTHTDVNHLRYELLQLRKKRSYFYGRTLLHVHLIRSDGTVRDNCGEIARAMAYHWSFQPVKNIQEFIRHTAKRMTRKRK